jgi:hypothetical protein
VPYLGRNHHPYRFRSPTAPTYILVSGQVLRESLRKFSACGLVD